MRFKNKRMIKKNLVCKFPYKSTVYSTDFENANF